MISTPAPRQQLAVAPVPPDHWERVGEVFRILGSPLRVGIIALLHDQESSVTELVHALGVSQPLVSQHLRVLRDSEVVACERRGREMIYRLADPQAFDLVLAVAEHDRACTCA